MRSREEECADLGCKFWGDLGRRCNRCGYMAGDHQVGHPHAAPILRRFECTGYVDTMSTKPRKANTNKSNQGKADRTPGQRPKINRNGRAMARKKGVRKTDLPHDDPDFPHGIQGYQRGGCRCTICTESNTEHTRRHRGSKPRQPKRHGTRTMYNTCTAGEGGGKCELCREANRVYQREYMRNWRSGEGWASMRDDPLRDQLG